MRMLYQRRKATKEATKPLPRAFLVLLRVRIENGKAWLQFVSQASVRICRLLAAEGAHTTRSSELLSHRASTPIRTKLPRPSLLSSDCEQGEFGRGFFALPTYLAKYTSEFCPIVALGGDGEL